MSILNVVSLLGGVGLFLYGMSIMSTGLKNAAGDKLRGILEKVTSNRIAAVFIGILITMLIQSSSATDMMVIGFVSSGLMQLGQAVGVIMGANIGTTVTAQITAFDLTSWAPLILFLGAVISLFISKRIIKSIGSVILGFGMLFVGIGLIKAAIVPLSQSEQFKNLLSALDHPLLGVLFGVLFTALLQSSSSSVVIFQAFAVQGLLTYHETVWLVIGAAIGSVGPNLLASLTTGRAGKRTALLNLTFNLFRAALLSLLITIFPGILTLIQNLSPADVGRQVANTHTLFAIFAVLCALPLSGLFVKLSQKLVPLEASETRAQEDRRLIYLTGTEKQVPAVAMKQAMLEVTRMGKFARTNLDTSLQYFFDPSDTDKERFVADTEATVDYLNHAITDRLVELRLLPLGERDIFRLSKMTLIVSHFERISDHAENIMEFADRLKEQHVTISEAGMGELRQMGDAVLETLDSAMQVFEEERFELIPQTEKLEQRVDDMQETFMQHHIDRLMVTHCDPLAGVVFTDMCTDLERCSDQALNIATAMVPGRDERAARRLTRGSRRG